jgi:hypothetical protein
MSQPYPIRLSSWARLVGLALLLGVGVLASLGLATKPAHAQAAASTTISTCDDATLRSAIANANSGDTISFGCDGIITLSSTLVISQNLTLDGNGHRVTLDGGNSVKVLTVSSGVTFTLNTLTVAHGTAPGSNGGGLDNKGGTVSISNSTFANNSDPTGGGGGLYNDIGGTVSISSCGFTGTGSLQNANPQLSALADNGGPTQTMALQQESPAIDRIPAANCPAQDQLGNARPDDAESTCDIGAYESNSPPDSNLGLSNVPADITVDASSPQGAVVTYTLPTATDGSGDTSTAIVSCTPASGSVFPIGTTTVTCTATDSDDTPSSVSQSFTVTVKDVTPPTLSLPDTIMVNATSPQGASVSYTVTASDPDNPSSDLTISCSPASGSTFAIGTTTVNCTATDPSGNSSSGSFQVVVKGTAAQVKDLIATVNGMGLSSSLQSSLDNKLNDVLTAINGGQTTTACSELTDFIGHIQSQSGKGLTSTQATKLIAAAKQIQAVQGC